MSDNIQELFTDQIDLPTNNMRKHIDRDAIDELAADIKKNGLISPVVVRPKNNRYELVAGQRRYLAHQVGGIIRIKCIIKELTDEEAFAVMTSENLARADVNPVDEAEHVARLLEMQGGDIKAVMRIVGKGEKWVNDRVAIGQMPDYMKEYLAKGQIKIGVCLALCQIDNEVIRERWTHDAAMQGISVAVAEHQLSHYKLNKATLDGITEDAAKSEAAAAPTIITLDCAIDGKSYDARLMKSVLVYEGNLPLIGAFASEWRKQSANTESAPDSGGGSGAAVAAPPAALGGR